MTTEARFDRQLPAVLEDLYLGPTPDYRDEVLTAATATRQRPAWTFPGRWLPMADIASRPTFAPRVPWRTVGVAFVIIALLVAAAVIYVGSRQTRLPPPFGVARNGSIAWARNGDIYTGDPIAGTTRAIVVGDEVDQNPIYSRDGTKLAFFRQVPNQAGLFDLAVVGRDGGEVSIVSAEPIRVPALAEWAPDGTAILVNDADDRLLRFDATHKATPIVIALGARIRGGAFRPPDGGQVLIERDTVNGTGLYLLNADGSGAPTTLIEAGPATNGGAPTVPAWSPNGRYIAFRVGTEGALHDDVRMYVIQADGTGMVKLDSAPGYWVESDAVWSPDSTHIAFNRWQYSDTAAGHQIRPIGIVQVAGGPVVGVGSTPVPDGALFDYSPDGSALLSLPGNVPSVFNWSDGAVGTAVRPELIDVNDGAARQFDLAIDSAASWQRLAPES